MIRLMPWEVGLGELFARPVARARIQGLSRIAAPTHSPSFWLAMWTAVAAAGFAALIPVLFDRGPPVPGVSVVHDLAGVAFAACGLIAWRRRPDSAVGRLLTVAGFGIVLSSILTQVDSPVTFTLAMLFGELWIAVFATLILSFVTGGRLTSTVDVILVGAFVVGLFVLQFAVLLFVEQDDNLLLVWPDAGIASALDKVRMGVLAVASLAVAFVVAERWRSASAPRRRALLPSVGGACAVCCTPPGSRASSWAHPWCLSSGS
jgi:hypothetical protein